MEECCAPQWIDFNKACSPQVPMQDYFEKEHTIHGRIVDTPESASENAQTEPMDPSCASIKAQHDLDILKSTPVKVISPKSHNKNIVMEETTYDEVLQDAMKKLELCTKSSRTRNVLNKTAQESNTDIFKTPSMPVIKSSKSVGNLGASNKYVQPNTAPKSASINRDIYTQKSGKSINMKNTLVSCSLFKQDKDVIQTENVDKWDKLIHGNIYNEEDDKKDNNEDNKKLAKDSKNDDKNNKGDNQDVLDATIEKCKTIPKRGNRSTVPTWPSRRRSFMKHKTSANHYISLAEAVSRFQNDTPKRFRTKNNKDSPSNNLSKLTQNRLKPTIPVSPALKSKNRARAVTVLSQEEREKQELEEMKKHQIKANPIPPNVLRGPRTLQISSRKTMVASNSTISSMKQPEKRCTKSILPKSPYHDKASSSKNTVTKVIVTDPSGIIIEREEITFFGVPKSTTTKNTKRVVPFSFEARNKDLQIKKEQRLKNLQEANKTKTEFHARPVPNFTKHFATPNKQQNMKKLVVLPFSFDERNKNLSKKKEELTKQVIEEDKKARVFRANPAPVFKPVLIRGASRDRSTIKEKTTRPLNIQTKYDDQENREPNVIVSNVQEESNIQKIKNIVDKEIEPPKNNREGNLKILPLELNTDKRARERREFNEKMKRKEMEENAKRVEENKEQIEHEKKTKIELRKLTEIKARPMPSYKPLIITKSTKPITNPQSPAFASKLKSKQV